MQLTLSADQSHIQ